MIGYGFCLKCGVGGYGICVGVWRHVVLNVGNALFLYNIVVDFVDITIKSIFSYKGWDD